ncbi:MAG TPA: response regulator [Candidatus Binatia bacterium]|jgi:CheY-like chemotaxis protein
MNGNGLKPIEILLVEDNIGDIRLTEEALKESSLIVNLSIARDGMEAMEFLRGEGTHANALAPDLILLDLNLPRKDGREVLQEIKNDADLKRIPVVVLTTSQAESDIIATYGFHANCYINKPVDMDQFIKIVKLLQEFWFTIVKLPPRECNGHAAPVPPNYVRAR